MATWDEAVAIITRCQGLLDSALTEGHDSYLEVFHDPPNGVALHEIDEQKRYVRVNRAELEQLGYTEAELLGRSVLELIVMQEASQRSIEQKLAGTKQLKPFMRTFKHKDGSAVVMVLLDRHILDKGGNPTGIRTAMLQLDQ